MNIALKHFCIAGALLLVLSACSGTPVTAPPLPADADAVPGDSEKQAVHAPAQSILFFFYRTIRCNECLTMEFLTDGLLKSDFAEAFNTGRLLYAAHNLDEPEFEHYADEFDLTFSSLVLVDIDEAGEILRWKELEESWEKATNPETLKEYVIEETNNWLGL